jgi:DNA-binding response OmpR family regulator
LIPVATGPRPPALRLGEASSRKATVRVLVVEDCRGLADLVAEGLSDQGMAADVAYDGTEAVGKLGLHSYDVVVLDRTLPGVPGDTLCEMIGSGDERSMVLILSGATSPEERVSGLRLGADDYLAKPFHFPELVLRVRALARRRPRAMPRVLRVGGIELDGLSRTVTRDARRLDLSTKELAVLEALMAASPCYLSAEQLLEMVWDEHADPFTKTVAVTIGRLRRKLGEPQPIETAVRVGYRIVVGPPALSCRQEVLGWPVFKPGPLPSP